MQEAVHILRRHWATEQVALYVSAAFSAEPVELLLGLNAFGGGLDEVVPGIQTGG
jgi:hypothetical protein